MNPDDLFVEAVEEWEDRLLAYALRWTHQRQDAEDAVQEALLVIWSNAKRPGWSRERLTKIMFLCVRQRVIDGHRRRTSQHAALVRAAQDGALKVDEEKDFQKTVAEVESITAAITQLPTEPPYRRVVEMQIAGLSRKEMADRLGCSLDRLNNWQHRARQLLHDALNNDWIP